MRHYCCHRLALLGGAEARGEEGMPCGLGPGQRTPTAGPRGSPDPRTPDSQSVAEQKWVSLDLGALLQSLWTWTILCSNLQLELFWLFPKPPKQACTAWAEHDSGQQTAPPPPKRVQPFFLFPFNCFLTCNN